MRRFVHHMMARWHVSFNSKIDIRFSGDEWRREGEKGDGDLTS